MYFKCCVPNCESKRKDVKLHKFPSDEVQRNKWLEVINSNNIKSLDPGELDKLLVCHNHFESRFKTPKSGVQKTAYPSLFSAEEIESGIPSRSYDDKEIKPTDHTYARKRHYDHSYCKQQSESAPPKHPKLLATDITDLPSTSNLALSHSHLPETAATDLTNLASTSDSTLSNLHQPEIAAADIAAVASSSNCKTINQRAPVTGKIIPTPRKACRKRLVQKFCKLSPKCKQLYAEYKKSRRMSSYNMRAKKALVFSKEQSFEEMTKKMNPLAKKFLWMQVKMCTKSKKGRRFSLEEKLVALSILKQSPKAYKFLQKIFILPSNTTLKKMIAELDMKAGLNGKIFAIIKKEVSGWDEKKKLCTVMFDEMALEPALVYSQKNDSFHGFVELKEKTDDLADHALVFLVRGAVSKWQQPVAFYFSAGAVSSQQLQVILKDVVSAVVETGLVPLALVCDQGSSFQSALRSMQENTRRDQIHASAVVDDTIQISGASLSVIFDPPHLIKGMRNNLLTKNITSDGKISTWEDIVDVYKTDCQHTQSRLLHKLNDEHVIPGKVKKMKVKNCVRVFSKTMAAALSYTAGFSHYTDGRPVSNTMKNTSDTVAFLDDLFDSVNGSNLNHKKCRGKELRKAVTENSPHHQFWKDARKKMENMKFIEKGSEKSVPTLKNWLTTIKSYERVWQVLKKKNVKIMRPRYFNSDPIENFFGRVRAYNFRNNDPTCHTFVSTFKSLLITGFIKFHSDSYNCEDDACDQLIKVQSLFDKSSEDNSNTTNIGNSTLNSEAEELNTENIQAQAARERLNIHSRAYTTGWVTKKVLEKIKCHECNTHLCTETDSSVHKWISQREYKTVKQKKLTYPSENAVRHFGFIIDETNEFLECNAHKPNITKEIKNNILSKYSFDFINCEYHKEMVLGYFLQISIKLCIFNWSSIINKILRGTDIIRLEKRLLPPMQKKALNKYKKKLRNKSFNK